MEFLFDADEQQYQYVVGIDLGTTNSAVAYVRLSRRKERQRTVSFFDVPQLVAAGEVAPQPVLPSFLYLPGPYDLPPGSTALPWAADRTYAVGTFGREQGARVPDRLVASAKSWLGHAGVDRTADILPWGASDEVPRVSPVEASRRYLQHLREAWNHTIAKGRKSHLLEAQLVILTVPASFDEVARELTVTAARKAGLPRVVLLEEPLAAFYAWLAAHEDAWQDAMTDGQLILVCDVGGGTTDFSIVGLREGEAGLRFTRLAVGDHLMLGGDNMDYALGRHVERELMGAPGKLDAQRWHQLVHQCRSAKEALLSETSGQETADVTVVGAGGNLIAGTLTSSLHRQDVQQLLLDGFFPTVAADETTPEMRRTGLTELGLPYVQDPAITRHLAAFWNRFAAYLQAETGRAAPYPDFILFNGGALTPPSVQQRMQETIGQWFSPVAGADWTPTVLTNPRLDLAVAIGAAYYGRVRLGEGVRVGSGSPRAYFVGVETQGPVQSAEGIAAVCLVPRGVEEGFQEPLAGRVFQALTNQPVAFQVYSSSTRLGDALGDVVQLDPDEVSTLPPIRTVLRYGKKAEARHLPVQLAVRLTAVGTLELWCQSLQSEHRWQLQFDVRQEAEPAQATTLEETIGEALIEAAQDKIQKTFQRGVHLKQHTPEALRRALEEILERPRDRWPVALIRKLADTLLDTPRGSTPAHEARWFNLLGYCLRPGYGDPVDAWRMKEVWKLHFEGLRFGRDTQCRAEWWVFWRRVAGGLSAGKQARIYHEIRSALKASRSPGRRRGKRSGGGRSLDTREEQEMWMALANFERLSPEIKTQLGRQLLQKIRSGTPQVQELWALSRLGARTTIYGPQDALVPSDEVVAWLDVLAGLHLEQQDGMAHALVNLARYTGDRTRDVPAAARERVQQWLAQVPEGERLVELLVNPESAFRDEEQDWMFGESLPAGLVLTPA